MVGLGGGGGYLSLGMVFVSQLRVSGPFSYPRGNFRIRALLLLYASVYIL